MDYTINGISSGLTLGQSDTMKVVANGIANETTVNGGKMHVSSGGTATGTMVSSDGSMTVSGGGTANRTTLNVGALHISSGGTANGTTVNYLGRMIVFSGGTASSTTVNYCGYLYVSSGGSASHITLANGACYNFVVASDTYIQGIANGSAFEMKNARIDGFTVNSNGNLCVSSGGMANSTTVNYGSMYVSSGGTANSTTVNYGGKMHVSSGGTANSTTVNSYGYLYVDNCGTANNTTVNNDGNMTVTGNGTANHITVNSGGRLSVCVESVANNITVHSHGTVVVGDNLAAGGSGAANSIMVMGGFLHVSRGTVTSTTVNSGGSMWVDEGGTATSTTVNSGGLMTVSSVRGGATATGTTVSSGGSMIVSSGGAAPVLAVMSGGQVDFGNDVFTPEEWTIAEGGVVNFADGAGIDFDLRGRTESSGLMINDLTLIDDSITYSVTVDENQDGTYRLAGASSAFTGTIRLRIQAGKNTSDIGAFSVDTNILRHESFAYALVRDDTAISLSIKLNNGPADAPIVFPGVTAPTNQNVLLVASYSENSVKQQYSFDNSEWLDYAGPVTVTENRTVYFRGVDSSDKATVTTYEVKNIDRVAPDAPTVSASTTETTWDNVILTVTYSGDTAKKQYSLNGTDWLNGTGTISVGENGTWYFRGIDAAGNISAVTSYTVSNIDRTAPKVTASIVKPTNQFVTLTAIYSDGSVKKQYSFDGRTWQNYTGPVTVSENGTVYFRGIDSSGDPMTVTAYEVKNIDRVAPDAPVVTASTEAPTNQNVTLSVVFSDDTATKQYSTDNKTWKSYTGAITVSANGTRYFRGIDEAGNISQVVSYTVSNIDRTAPPAPTVKADITALTNKNVTLTATCSDDTAVMQYSTDKQTWLTFRGTVTASANGTWYFRGIDAAGNISQVTTFKVTNIDRTAPKAPTVWADITAVTNKNVTLTAAFSSDTKTKQYSTDNKTWKSYTKAISVSANGTWYFRGIDAAGNPSPVTSCKVSNIDKVAPTAPTVKASTTAATNKAVTLTAAFSSDTVTKQYSTDNKTWKSYSSGVSASTNGSWYFRGIDAAGNVSKVTSYKVANIDRTAPSAPTVKVSTTEWTNGKVSLTAAFSGDTKTKQYSTDSKTWKSYTGAVTASANGTWYFRGIDAAGNVSKVTTYKVSNITATRAPSGIAVQTGKSNVTCTWDKYAAQKGVKISYQVKVDGSSQVKSVSSSKFSMKNAAAGAHTLSVRTVSRQGGKTEYSPWRTISLTVADVIAPKLVAVGSSVKDYTGTVLFAAADNVAVKRYLVTMDGMTKTVAGTKNSASFTGLAIGKHTASVQAFDAAGNAGKARKVTLTVKDVTAPGKVSKFNAVSVAKGQAALSWDAVSDNSGQPVSYEVELSTGKIVKAKTTSCSVKLAAGSYTYRVRAVDKAKNVGAWSAAQKFSIATAAKSAAIALSYCDTLRLDAVLQAAADASSLTANVVKEQAYLAAL